MRTKLDQETMVFFPHAAYSRNREKKVDNGEWVTEVLAFTDWKKIQILNHKENIGTTNEVCILVTCEVEIWELKWESGGLLSFSPWKHQKLDLWLNLNGNYLCSFFFYLNQKMRVLPFFILLVSYLKHF